MNKGKKRRGELVITGSHAAKSLNFIEKAFDQMTFLIKPKIAKPRVRIIISRRNGVIGIMFGNISSDFFSPICFVTKNITA